MALRKRGVNAVSAHELGHIELSDAEQLSFAARHRRCLVSANARDFTRLGRASIEQGRPHAGIALCPSRIHGLDLGAAVKPLVGIAKRSPAGLGEYDVLYL